VNPCGEVGAHNAGVRSADPVSKLLPRWALFLVTALPGLATAVLFLLLGLTDHLPQIFNLSIRDSMLVLGIGSVLVFTIVSLTILSLVLSRALRH